MVEPERDKDERDMAKTAWPGRFFAALHDGLARLTEHHLLFPGFAVLLLIIIWGTTWSLIRSERISAERQAEISTVEMTETYEAQVLRAVREIDQTLRVIKFTYERNPGQTTLAELKRQNLLPPDLLFTIEIHDAEGRLMDSTRRGRRADILDRESFSATSQVNTLAVGAPTLDPVSHEWKLHFSRRLEKAGHPAGIVALSVGADYFVSGYETAKVGQSGVLGIVGSDGIFRARRTGDVVTAGDRVESAAFLPNAANEETRAWIEVSPWDHIRRYISARQLYEFPLITFVGLSADEQLAGARHVASLRLWQATAASVVLLLVIALLWRMSWQLALTRMRESEERIAHARRVEYLAYHDGLTGLPNRSLFTRLLEQAITQGKRYNRQLAVLFLDLDRFKQINDTLGHEAGDDLLKEVAARLSSCLRESDTVARLGGDEFVVLLPEIDNERMVSTVAQKMLTAIAKPFVLLNNEFRVTVSIGISIYPQDGLDEQTLKKNADIAMYQAKEQGKNNFQFYSVEINANSLERLTLESALRRALEINEFQIHYQAVRDVHTGRITGTECLLRWQHPDLGTIAPQRFIPVAEEMGLMVKIGRWMLKTACQQNMAWQREGLPALIIAVDLSASQFFDDNLLPYVNTALEESAMPASLLELEVTEDTLMRNLDKALPVLTALKSAGVRIAIDDFGMGYSSISRLRGFPLDTVKIDRSFVRLVGSGLPDEGLADAIIAMGRTLSPTIVAQGVETKEQAEFLRAHACDELQGFLFNEPVAADQFGEILSQQAQPTQSES